MFIYEVIVKNIKFCQMTGILANACRRYQYLHIHTADTENNAVRAIVRQSAVTYSYLHLPLPQRAYFRHTPVCMVYYIERECTLKSSCCYLNMENNVPNTMFFIFFNKPVHEKNGLLLGDNAGTRQYLKILNNKY